MQCFEVRCHACILTCFWNIGPFHLVELLLSMTVSMCLKSCVEICLSHCPSCPSHLKEEIPNPLFSDLFQKCMICHCFLSCSYQYFNLSFLKLRVFFFLQHKNLFEQKIFKSLGFCSWQLKLSTYTSRVILSNPRKKVLSVSKMWFWL